MPSLTLTDPDMILPFDGSERESQTPSPPSQLVYLSNLNARYNSSDPHANLNSNSISGSARPKKNFSRSAWTHDDLSTSASRRLSDIGEELSPARSVGFDEEEESQGGYQHGQGYGQDYGQGQEQSHSQSQNHGYYHSHNQPQYTGSQGLTSWPGLPDSTEQDNASSSSSTVSAGSTRARVEPSKQSAPSSQDPLEIQAQVQAQAQAHSTSTTEIKGLPDKNTIASAVKGKGPGDEFSSAILSSEAERILDNAKKRLTLMEGNLNRARSSVRLTPSPSPSAPGNTSPMGMPAGGLYRSISKTDRRGSILRRQSNQSSQDVATNRHSRVHSETNFPAESSLSSDTKKLSRSVSAMGSSSSSFHNDDRSFRYEPTRSYLTHRASISSMKPPYIEGQSQQSQSRSQSQSTSHENSAQSPQSARSGYSHSPVATHSPVSISHEDTSEDSPRGLGISADDDSKSTNGGDFSPVYSSYGPPSRAQSQLQVRDLQYQMKGLHIKISSLKVRTQEDNLRRRSLQSLRTPSPLTAADPWYQNGLEIRDGTSSRGSNARDSRPTSQMNLTKENNSPREPDEIQANNSQSKHQTSSTWQDQTNYAQDRNQSTAASMYEDAEEGDYNDEIDREALDEILREPLDEDLEMESQADFAANGGGEGVPHEEREDAFDYEHFILHSALGNYSRQLRRTTSNASRGSTETTRPMRPIHHHSRTNSNMSDSTVATFATATEGEIPEEEDDLNGVMYWDRRFNHELRHRHIEEDIPQETDRSETPRGPRVSTSGETTPIESTFHDANGRSSSATTGSATPTSLVTSLVSTVRAASGSSPHPGSATPISGGINDDDTAMLEQLFSSLGNVCMDLQAITTSPDPDIKSAKILRRRLDAARRVLDGELDT